jgi:hypothetical protein
MNQHTWVSMSMVRKKSLGICRVMSSHLLLAAMLVLSGLWISGCTTAPEAIKAVVVPPTYSELMTSADEAIKNAAPTEALSFFDRAAKLEPAKKEPWLRMAKMYFDARNYGATISSCNEVLVRDNSDIPAKSMLAVSGLRVSVNALEQLRAVNQFGGDTRQEAQALAHLLRAALGSGSILPETTTPTPPRRPSAPRRTPVSEAASPTLPQAPAASRPPTAPVETKPANPFR